MIERHVVHTPLKRWPLGNACAAQAISKIRHSSFVVRLTAFALLRPLFLFILLPNILYRSFGCFFHGMVNIFESFMEPAGRNPAALNEFNYDFLGGSQYLFIDVCHAPSPAPESSVGPTCAIPIILMRRQRQAGNFRAESFIRNFGCTLVYDTGIG